VYEAQLRLARRIAPFDCDNSNYDIACDSSFYPTILDKSHRHRYIQLTGDAQLYRHICRLRETKKVVKYNLKLI
jgi:hypothetical protein